MTDFQTTPDFFDSRDVIERIETLANVFEETTGIDPREFSNLASILDHYENGTGLDENETEELYELLAFAADAAEVSDWEYGETFIHVNEFPNYARELVEECGYVPANLPEWIVIDWEETAENLRQDYTTYTFRGEEYLARA